MIRTLIQDTLMAMLLGVVAVAIFILPSINPPAEADPISQPGNLIASISWPSGPIDVDIWVSHANEKAVGYSNKSGKVWSLLRDDLGEANDATPLNYESAFTRGLPDGEYAVNVRCFGCAKVPVPVAVEVRLAEGGMVWAGTVQLERDKQERTAIRFRVLDGAVVQGSESQVFKQMKRGDA
ncbi:hypothetical protein [Metarhizobium album]|nr:hypothetical protein [Rhizobium album]